MRTFISFKRKKERKKIGHLPQPHLPRYYHFVTENRSSTVKNMKKCTQQDNDFNQYFVTGARFPWNRTEENKS